jgi:hypothetical protein
MNQIDRDTRVGSLLDSALRHRELLQYREWRRFESILNF